MTPRLLPLILCPVLLAGCGSRTAGSAEEPDAIPSPGDYTAVELPAPYAPGDQLRMTVRAGELSVQATCNTYSGRARWEGGVLKLSGMGGTEMGCLDGGAEQDEWLVEVLTGSPEVTSDGEGFTLASEGVELRLVPAD